MKSYQKSIFALSVFLTLAFFPTCHATSITSAEVINPKWSVGKPWEPIQIRMNITGSDKILTNVTIYYSFNTTENWIKDSMYLSYGNNITGSWDYIIQGQADGSIIYFYSKIFYEDGSYEQIRSNDNPRVWKIRLPDPYFRIHFFSVENIDEKKLTADIKVSFEIVDDIDADYREVILENHLSELSISEYRYVKVLSSSQRYRYFGQLDIKGLRLSGDTTRFPYDDYQLWLEFNTRRINSTKNDIVNVNLAGNETYIWEKDWSTDTLEDGSIRVTTNFIRRNQSIFWFVIPLQVFLFIMAASMMINPIELGNRLMIFTGLIFYLFTFSNQIRSFVPERAYGTSFAEIFIPYLALFTTGYLIFSIINYTFNKEVVENISRASKEQIFAISFYIDLVIVALPLAFVFIPVIKSELVTLKLVDIMPQNLYRMIYVIPVAGLVFRILFYFLSRYRRRRYRPRARRARRLDDYI